MVYWSKLQNLDIENRINFTSVINVGVYTNEILNWNQRSNLCQRLWIFILRKKPSTSYRQKLLDITTIARNTTWKRAIQKNDRSTRWCGSKKDCREDYKPSRKDPFFWKDSTLCPRKYTAYPQEAATIY